MEQVRIDFVPGGVTPNAHASQYDIGRVIRFKLYNSGSPYTLIGTETITVKMTKPDGTEETISLTNTSSDYVDFTTTGGLLNQAGIYPCEISLTAGGDTIGSQNFNLKAEADAYGNANIVILSIGPLPICTFDTTLAEPYQSVTVNVVATGGNGTPDNPIPINGYSEANITRCGKNLLNMANCIDDYFIHSGTKTVTSIEGASVFYCNVPKNTNLTITPNTSNRCVIMGYKVRPQTIENSVGDELLVDSASGITSQTINTGDNTFIVMYLNRTSEYKPTQLQVEVGTTATAYEPYNGNTYTIAFGQTVYGGVLDVTSGKLTVTHGYVDLGSLTWISAITNVAGKVRMRAALTHKAVPNSVIFNAKCDIYTAITASNTYTCVDGISGENTGNYIFVYDSNYSTTADLPAFISMVNGHYLAYELATSFDIDLTPVQISALTENNVFADCGEITVEYLAER